MAEPMGAHLGRAAMLLREAAASLALHRLRAGLSALGIVCGVLSFVVILSLGEGARRETLAQISALGMSNVLVRASALSEEQARKARDEGSAGLVLADAGRLLRAEPAVEQVAALREVPATVVQRAAQAAPLVLAVTPNFLEVQGLQVAAGRFIAEDDVRERRLACVLGADFARRLAADGHPGATLRIEGSVCRVVGVLRRFRSDSSAARGRASGGGIALRDYDDAVVLPLGTEGAFAPAPGSITELVARMRGEDRVMPGLPGIRRALAVAHHGVDDYTVVAPQELLARAAAARRNFDILAASLAAICLLVGGIGIMNTLLAAVTERTREIGIRRALGATRRHIALQFMSEALLLVCAGAAAGLVLGAAAVLAVSAAAGWPVAISAATLALPALCALGAGLFFGIAPALRAARLDPIAALRHD
jgi:putative ABC transport system permease protein